MRLRPSIDDRQAVAELRRENRAVAAAERTKRTAEKDLRRAARRARLRQIGSSAGARIVFVLPLVLVTAFAVYGQYGYGFDHYTAAHDPVAYKVAIAIGAALALESIANYVQWHAHRARLAGAAATAGQLSRVSYLIGGGVAALNYAHFCGPGGVPNPAAVMFAAFSAASPWLWALHTQRAEYEQLREEGLLDRAGAQFRPERWRHFPIATWRARRYSIMHNIADPAGAWDAYQADRRAAAAVRDAGRAQRRGARYVASGGNPWRALLVRAADLLAPPPGATSGARPGPAGGAPAGAALVRLATQPAGAAGVSERAVATPSGVVTGRTGAGDDAALQDTAARWALAHLARGEALPGWRQIRARFPALTEYRAKEAAKAARERAAGTTAVKVGGAKVVIRAGGDR